MSPDLDPTAPEDDGRNRKLDMLARPLGPASLCGSWFHSEDSAGLVVAEPQAGVYLVEFHVLEPVELHDWHLGEPLFQRLVKLDEMSSWRFFDNPEWMKQSFQKHRKEIEAP